MTKTLYLHVGMPKCASTTIQGVLRDNAPLFQEQGRFFGVAPGDTVERQGNATQLLHDVHNRKANRIKAALDFFFNRDCDVILSSEMFIGLARTQLAKDLLDQIAEYGFETRIICLMRRQDHWIESDFKQHLKGGSDWVDPIEALIEKRVRTKVLDYHWLMERWAAAVGRENICVVPLRPGQGNAYPAERFMEFIGLDPALLAGMDIARRNVSPPVALIEPMRRIKIALLAEGVPVSETGKPLMQFVKDVQGLIDVPQRRFLLSLDRRRELLQQYAESNRLLRRHYLNGDAAFEEAVEDEESAVPGLSDQAAEILGAYAAASRSRIPQETQKKGLRARLLRR